MEIDMTLESMAMEQIANIAVRLSDKCEGHTTMAVMLAGLSLALGTVLFNGVAEDENEAKEGLEKLLVQHWDKIFGESSHDAEDWDVELPEEWRKGTALLHSFAKECHGEDQFFVLMAGLGIATKAAAQEKENGTEDALGLMLSVLRHIAFGGGPSIH
jgi:hypothetical protein